MILTNLKSGIVVGVFFFALVPFSLLSNELPDSIWVNSERELEQRFHSGIKVLILNFSLGEDFNFDLMPVGLVSLRFKKSTRGLKSLSKLAERLDSLEEIELVGDMLRFLPELLFAQKAIRRVYLSNSELNKIFEISGFLVEVKLDVLYLSNMKYDKDCQVFKMLFYGERLSSSRIEVLGDCDQPNEEEQAFLMDLFQTTELFIGGKRQVVYP